MMLSDVERVRYLVSHAACEEDLENIIGPDGLVQAKVLFCRGGRGGFPDPELSQASAELRC